MMNKLGFAIKIANEGVKTIIECNRGQWSSKVVDIREYLNLFTGLQGTDNAVTFMSFDESGCFLTLLRAIPGRGGNFSSGWIYIPNEIEIPTESIENTYRFVANLLSESDLTEQKNHIEDFFAQEYKQKEIRIKYTPSKYNGKFGFRYFGGDYTYREILEYGYQSCYSEYQAIFLLEESGVVEIANGQTSNFDNLMSIPLKKQCILKAPSHKELESLGRDVKIKSQNGTEFTSPKVVYKGDTVHYTLNREGFESIDLPSLVIQDEIQTLSIDTGYRDKWQKKITKDMFNVENNERKPIENYQVKINNRAVTPNGILMTEKDCYNAKVEISAAGFETEEATINLLNMSKTPFQLKRKTQKIEYDVKMSNGKIGKMTLSSQNLPKNKWPRKSYPLKWHYLDKSEVKPSPVVYIFIVAAFIIGAALGGVIVWLWLTIKNPSDASSAQEKPTTEAQQPNPKEEMTAKEYLSNNGTWKKSEMEKYPELKGLFDDLNSFNRNEIIQKWKPCQLGEKMEEVVKLAEEASTNRCDLSSEPPFTKGEEINVQKYIEHIRRSIERSKTRRHPDDVHKKNSERENENGGL